MSELGMPDGYAADLAELRDRVRNARERAQRQVNTELIGLYWSIGRTMLLQQERSGWGAGVVDQLARDLRGV